jgi:cyclopropane fatty-acyl-phospholipid synthase-like methyltransferase
MTDEVPEKTGDGSGTQAARVGEEVRAFYAAMPFNFHGSVEVAVESIRENQVRESYPDLHALLESGQVASVLEIGCGAGWLANSLAAHYGVRVTAVDFCGRAVERAREVAGVLGVAGQVEFLECDLFEYEHEAPVDLVISLGVLHVTGRCEAAFHHVRRFVAEGRFLYIGLYHEPGRRVFLDMFHAIIESEGEEAAFRRYRELDALHAADETMSRSWFRDQVIHPHETLHTLREVCGWMSGTDLCLLSTSVNRFAPIDDVAELFEVELEFAERSRRANCEEGRFFPGFFTFLAGRAGAASRDRTGLSGPDDQTR